MIFHIKRWMTPHRHGITSLPHPAAPFHPTHNCTNVTRPWYWSQPGPRGGDTSDTATALLTTLPSCQCLHNVLCTTGQTFLPSSPQQCLNSPHSPRLSKHQSCPAKVQCHPASDTADCSCCRQCPQWCMTWLWHAWYNWHDKCVWCLVLIIHSALTSY